MGLGVRAAPFTYVAHALAVAAAVMVLVWAIHFRGGLAIEATNKNLIFNVHPVLMLIGYIIIGSEGNNKNVFRPLAHEQNFQFSNISFIFGSYNGIQVRLTTNYHEELDWFSKWIFGLVTFFFPGAAPNLRKSLLPWHILFGLFVYILALANAELGFLEKLTFLESSGLDKYGTEAFLVNFTALIVVLFGASVMVAAIAPARLEEPQGYAPIPEN
ncbi:Ascorbate-specific transmembrane electron transporter 2 [Dichanthelium oligosanthes]|uniref:Ascorbate-specific transmembrane electron transporter 2 n=1 Tax=Dichanthelium oligosanthes TaxID=888268 RepID=A0A1E5UN66_9POAL|nr:Ascorbate-specific transmembrane electron transporter 2 [Dichanthelium oligosanthes]